MGAVSVGQRASFTVEAYPDKIFWGKVVQIRRAPITVQNVVTYDVVVGVQNPDLLLLPGMTADTRIVTAECDGVLRVPVQALRYAPQGIAGSTTVREGAESGAVWVLRQGRPERVSVATGIEDGTFAEITGGALKLGDQVVVGETTGRAGGDRRGSADPLRPRL